MQTDSQGEDTFCRLIYCLVLPAGLTDRPSPNDIGRHILYTHHNNSPEKKKKHGTKLL